MIDTHCHLLPGLDDGPRSIDEAVAFGAALSKSGVDRVLCTPHFSRRYPTRHEQALRAAEALRLELDGAGIRLFLHVAAEISPLMAMTAGHRELRARAIGRRFILVELETSTAAPVVTSLVERLRAFRLVPAFAHPERCRAVSRDPLVLTSARESGALVQVVASSLRGSWGETVADVALRLLERGHVDMLASDAHRPRSAGALGIARVVVREQFGAQMAQKLTVENPARFLQGLRPAVCEEGRGV